MATVTFKGEPINTAGDLPAIGSRAPFFKLTGGDLLDVTLDNFAGKRKILSIVPSLDIAVCQASARRFNEEIAKLEDTIVLYISADLPFAQGRFCEAEGLRYVVPLSTMRAPSFGKDYGVAIEDSPLAGLLSGAVLVLDENDTIIHTQQVPEIAEEPDYDAALLAVAS